MDDRLSRADQHYQDATFRGDRTNLAAAVRDLDAVEADLSMCRGRLLHAEALAPNPPGEDPADEDPAGIGRAAEELAFFERATELYRSLGDARGEGEAQLWVGICHQVVGRDQDAAVPALGRAGALARRAGDDLTLSYVLRHLGIAEHAAGNLDAARSYLEESTTLRRDLDFHPGVAANLVGLAYLAAAQGRRDDALTILTEATALAETSGAHAILTQITEARTTL